MRVFAPKFLAPKCGEKEREKKPAFVRNLRGFTFQRPATSSACEDRPSASGRRGLVGSHPGTGSDSCECYASEESATLCRAVTARATKIRNNSTGNKINNEDDDDDDDDVEEENMREIR
jgi:hypothetical protein